jgi:adenylylsulfate reductase subunit A
MTMSQALIWASENIDPAKTPSEIVLTEPYLMGSHASATGAWVSGPEDMAPPEYFWGYNRMTTVKGLFAAGDGVGGSSHKFSSGSYTEGRLAGKAAVAYIADAGAAPTVDPAQVEALRAQLWKPFENYEKGRPGSTREDVNPNYVFPKMALHRLQKIMDEYAGGQGSQYITTEAMLQKGLERLQVFKEDLERQAARDLHDLLRCWEVWDRTWCAEAHMQHLLFRQETRWPGYYYRADFPALDDQNWRVFVNSRRDPVTGAWKLEKAPFLTKIP